MAKQNDNQQNDTQHNDIQYGHSRQNTFGRIELFTVLHTGFAVSFNVILLNVIVLEGHSAKCCGA